MRLDLFNVSLTLLLIFPSIVSSLSLNRLGEIKKRAFHPLHCRNQFDQNNSIEIVAAVDQNSVMLNTEVEDDVKAEVGPVLRNSLIFLLTTVIQLSTDTVITAFIAHLGNDYAAARGIANTIIGLSFFLFGFLVDGTTAQVSRAYGEGDRKKLGGSIKLSVAGGLIAGLLTLALFGPGYQLWLAPFNRPDVNYVTVPYFLVRLAGMPFNLVYNALVGVLQGLQLVNIIFIVNLCISAIDIVTNYLFIFKLNWSIVGAPLGINLAFLAGMFACIFFLLRPRQKELFTLFPLLDNIPSSLAMQRFRESLSLMSRTFTVEIASYATSVMLSRSGQTSFVAYSSVLSEINKYSYFVPMSLASAGNMLGSSYLGQRSFAKFRQLVRIILGLAVVLAVIFAAIPAFLIKPITGLLVAPDQVSTILGEIMPLLPLLIFTQPVNCLLTVYQGFMYATQSFQYMRNVDISAFLFVFAPALVASLTVPGFLSLTSMLGALTAFSSTRLLAYMYRLHVQVMPRLEIDVLDGQVAVEDPMESVKKQI